jgi:hypothetical protein
MCEQPYPDNAYEIDLHYCAEDDPPARMEDPSVEELCTLNCLLDVPFHDLRVRRSKTGVEYREYEYDVEMTSEHASLEFALVLDGRTQGKRTVEVTYEDGYSQKTMEELVSRMGFVD